MKKTLAIGLALIAALTLSGCDYQAATVAVRGVVENGNWNGTADKNLIGCINPGETKNELNNRVYWYPAHQISWSATNDPGSQRGPYDVVSSAKAPADMLVPLTVTFDLTDNCDALKDFHSKFATKYQGWLENADGRESDGWKQLVNYVIGQPLQNTLNTVSQNYTWQQIWNDEQVRREFTEAIARELPNAAKERTEGVAYFSHYQVAVYKPTPANPDLKKAIEDQQAAVQRAQALQASGVAEANAAKAKADADVIAAEAQTKLAEQQALQREAEIKGYGSVDAYLRALAIKQGLNPFQPGIGPVPTQGR